jgi:hypothetical protein
MVAHAIKQAKAMHILECRIALSLAASSNGSFVELSMVSPLEGD